MVPGCIAAARLPQRSRRTRQRRHLHLIPRLYVQPVYLDVQLPVGLRHLLVVAEGVLLHPASLQAQQRAPQVAVAPRRQARRQRPRQRQLLPARHVLQLLRDALLAGRRHADAQAPAAHGLDDLQAAAGGALGASPVYQGVNAHPAERPAVLVGPLLLGAAPTLETLLQASTRRQAAEYFSMVRRSECCASLLSRSTSFSTSTCGTRGGGWGKGGMVGVGWGGVKCH